jgi:hypothetical protein
VFARSELGLQSMASRGLSAALKFFGKLVRMPQTRLAAHIFRLRCDHADELYYQAEDRATHRLGDYSWCREMKGTLSKHGCTDHWRRRFVPANWGRVVSRIVNEHEVQLTADQFDDSELLDLYKALPRSGGPEQWLSRTLAHPGVRIKVMMRANCVPVYERVAATRNYNVPRQARLCKFCDLGAVEDVTHVVSTCPCYGDLRQDCLRRLDACLHEQNVPQEILSNFGDRSAGALTRMFLGDVFQGLAPAAYQKAHGVILNYLKLLWKRRKPLWANFCAPGKEWQLLNPPVG